MLNPDELIGQKITSDMKKIALSSIWDTLPKAELEAYGITRGRSVHDFVGEKVRRYMDYIDITLLGDTSTGGMLYCDIDIYTGESASSITIFGFIGDLKCMKKDGNLIVYPKTFIDSQGRRHIHIAPSTASLMVRVKLAYTAIPGSSHGVIEYSLSAANIPVGVTASNIPVI